MTNPIANHPSQLVVWKNDKRFRVLCSGRRFGKSYLGREELLKASQKNNSVNIYIAPTRQQAKDIMWDALKQRVRELKWDCVINESELKITRRNNATIKLYSAEKPDRIRGLGIDFIVLDEIAEYRDPGMFNQVIRPALSDKNGKALFIGTPKGFNHFYELYQKGTSQEDWASFSFKTIDSPFFQTEEGKQEIADAKNLLDELSFKQEYEAEFIHFSGRIYYAASREVFNSDYQFDSNNGPIYVGLDFNHSPLAGVLFHRIAGHSVAFDEIYLKFGDTESWCREFKKRYPNQPAICNPDATGARRTSNSTQSDFEILKTYGFKIECGSVNPKRVDRWASTNHAFEKGMLQINTKKCPMLVKDLEQLCYREGACEPDLSDPMLGHISDAFSYHCYKYFSIVKTPPISVSFYT